MILHEMVHFIGPLPSTGCLIQPVNPSLGPVFELANIDIAVHKGNWCPARLYVSIIEQSPEHG